jgi:hypothetical protein
MMRRMVVILSSLLATLAAVLLFWACLDTTPILVVRDAFDPDASCLRCLQQPEGCADLIASCETEAKCKGAYACMVAQTCLDLRTIDDKIKCGLPCAQEAGVESVSDPIVTTYLVGLVACGQEKCAEPCNLIDASIGF